ncbi:MAG: cyclase family protein [Anaerolineae bacterium]
MVFNIDPGKYRVIDISYQVDPDNYPPDRPFELTLGYLADNAFKYDVRTHSHVGTHIESPAHFFEGGRDVTGYPLDAFYGRAVLLDVPDASRALQLDAAYLEAAIGAVTQPGDVIICRNSDAASLAARRPAGFPTLTPSAATWMAERRIKLLGIDNNFRLGKDIPDGRELHDILMRDGVTFIEWLDNLSAIRQPVFFFMALPFKVRKMDSSWCRAIAIEER